MLTVPEEYAGQLMQCPLCRGTFQMPAAPQPAGASTMPAPPQPPRPQPPAPDSFNIPVPPSGVYNVAAEPKTAPPPPGGGFPPPPGGMDFAPVEMVQEVMPPPTTSGGYRHAIPLRFNPLYLQWIIPVGLILEFILTFFPWVGLYPGGDNLITQNALQAAFNGYSAFDKDFPELKGEDKPGGNLLMVFYVIFLWLTLLLSVGALVLHFFSGSPSPGMRTLMNLRWIVVGSLAFLVFLFFLIQLLVGFTIENRTNKEMEKKIEELTKKSATSAMEKMQNIVKRGSAIGGFGLHRTLWLRLAFLFQLLVVFCCVMVIWTSRRGHRPYPKLEFAW
jgi:hypothetical protein